MDKNSTQFDYELPAELIAQHPLRNRADARLMLVQRKEQSVSHFHVRDLPDLLKRGDQLVLNNTRVIPAQLMGVRADTGGRWQGLFLEATDNGDWRILCKSRGKLRQNEPIQLLDRRGRPDIKLWLLEKHSAGVWTVHPESEESHQALLDRVGRVPLPPYIRGGRMVDADVEDYQTVFAKSPGAVAAPTAGLHFSESLLRSIHGRGIGLSAVTLHVGLGTFQPISSESIEDHEMHREWCELSADAAQQINDCRAAGGRIVAVGTTCVRVLETAAQALAGPPEAPVAAWEGETQLFIRPPYEPQAVDALMTNFHFPRTTLLLLVEAFLGRELLKFAYEEAIREEYRFYSYGDAMLIL